MEPGRQTPGCNPRLEVLNLGLGTLNSWLDGEEPAGPTGLRSGTLLNCLFAVAGLGVGFDPGLEDKFGSSGSGAFGAGGGVRGEGFHCGWYGGW